MALFRAAGWIARSVSVLFLYNSGLNWVSVLDIFFFFFSCEGWMDGWNGKFVKIAALLADRIQKYFHSRVADAD